MTVWCFLYKLFIYKSLYSKLWLHSFEVYLFMLLRLQLPSTFSSSCQEHAWEWRVSGWNHLKASARQKTHNSDFKHKCSKDIKGISSEMKIRPWAFPKRKNSFKYDGSAPVEKRSMWATFQEENISVFSTTWALLDDGNMTHRNRKTLPGYAISYVAVCACVHVYMHVYMHMCMYLYVCIYI